jgi:hypothetical protein
LPFANPRDLNTGSISVYSFQFLPMVTFYIYLQALLSFNNKFNCFLPLHFIDRYMMFTMYIYRHINIYAHMCIFHIDVYENFPMINAYIYSILYSRVEYSIIWMDHYLHKNSLINSLRDQGLCYCQQLSRTA